MDPSKILMTIFKLAKTLHDINEQVKANKRQCQRLTTRVDSIVGALEGVSVSNFTGTRMEKTLLRLIETLKESIQFVQTFTETSMFERFVNHFDHEQQFKMLNTQLLECAGDLALALDVTSLFDQQQDTIDRQTDLAEISARFDEIAMAMAQQQQELVKQKKEIKDEFKRRFDSFKYHLRQGVQKAQNPNVLNKIDEESKLFRHIPGHDMHCEELIGQGGFADVYQGIWISQSHRVAIKKIRINQLTENVRQNILDEIGIMYRTRYDHVLNIFGACIEQNYFAIVVEYMSLGSLFDVLQKKKRQFSWSDRWSIALQCTKSVNYLHSMSILHRDIKSLNFLMDIAGEGYIVKISDFGLAKTRQESRGQSTEANQVRIGAGTLQWKAPELFKFSKPSNAADIYSLSIVFWELATGSIPYEDLDDDTIVHGVKSGERLEIPDDVPAAYASIIRSAWHQDPTKRPTAQELIQQILANLSPRAELNVTPKGSPAILNRNNHDLNVVKDEPVKDEVSPNADSLFDDVENMNKRKSKVEALVAQYQSLSAVNLNEEQLTDVDMEIVVQQIINKKRCDTLWLENNQISPNGASIIARALYNNMTLQELWLYDNRISDLGVRYLAHALSVNVTLQKLGLASNEITDAGVAHLAVMLKKNSSLNTLGLAMNKIGDQGIQILANALTQPNVHLQVLTLDRNPLINDSSVRNLTTVIARNQSLRQLWLNGCTLSNEGKKQLHEAAKSNIKLKLITVYEAGS